jgi:hypothetical protein
MRYIEDIDFCFVYFDNDQSLNKFKFIGYFKPKMVHRFLTLMVVLVTLNYSNHFFNLIVYVQVVPSLICYFK